MKHLDPGQSDFLGRHVQPERLETASSPPFPDHTVEHHLPTPGRGRTEGLHCFVLLLFPRTCLPESSANTAVGHQGGQRPTSSLAPPPRHELRPGFPTASRSGSHRRLCPHRCPRAPAHRHRQRGEPSARPRAGLLVRKGHQGTGASRGSAPQLKPRPRRGTRPRTCPPHRSKTRRSVARKTQKSVGAGGFPRSFLFNSVGSPSLSVSTSGTARRTGRGEAESRREEVMDQQTPGEEPPAPYSPPLPSGAGVPRAAVASSPALSRVGGPGWAPRHPCCPPGTELPAGPAQRGTGRLQRTGGELRVSFPSYLREDTFI